MPLQKWLFYLNSINFYTTTAGISNEACLAIIAGWGKAFYTDSSEWTCDFFGILHPYVQT
jgi:hypothetical protein